MRVYVIRHGESENNQKLVYTGWYNAPLTEKGREDAAAAAKFLQNISFDQVYASDLDRAVETAKIALPNASLRISPLLREIDVGRLTNTSPKQFTAEQRQEMMKNGYAAFGGESVSQMNHRIEQFKKELVETSFETVALFSHGGWLRGMLDSVVGTHLPRQNIMCNNCTIAAFEYADGCWRLHSWINLS